MTGPSPQTWFTSPKTQGGCHFHPLHSGNHRHPHNYHHNHSADSFHEHINEDDNADVRWIKGGENLQLPTPQKSDFDHTCFKPLPNTATGRPADRYLDNHVRCHDTFNP